MRTLILFSILAGLNTANSADIEINSDSNSAGGASPLSKVAKLGAAFREENIPCPPTPRRGKIDAFVKGKWQVFNRQDAVNLGLAFPQAQ